MTNRLDALRTRQRTSMLDELCAKFAREWHDIVHHPLHPYLVEKLAARPGYLPDTKRAYMERRAAEIVRWNHWTPEQASELASRVEAYLGPKGGLDVQHAA